MAEPTQRPWRVVSGSEATGIYSGRGKSMRAVASLNTPEKDANAALIVRAVNNFDGLVAALEELEWIHPLDESEPYCAECFGCQSDGHVPGCQLAAAIAKAKED